MSNHAKVVDLFNRDGSQSRYLLFSARLPDFMKTYPAEEGWRVEREAVSAASLQPELVQLYAAAVSAGKSPKDLGLPALPSGMLFKCRLLDPNGTVVRTASSLVLVRELQGQVPPSGGFKDWEAGETNAFQRLVASMGFGGDMLDADEKQLQGQDSAAVVSAAGPVAVIEVDDEPSPPVDDASSSVGGAPTKAVKPVAATKASGPDLFNSFKRQVELVARQQNLAMPDVKTVADCKRELAKMMPPPPKA